MQPKKQMAKLICRKIRKGSELRFDVRCLTFEEYKMLSALIRAAKESFDVRDPDTLALGTFDLTYIKCTVFADKTHFNTLAKLHKIL